MRLPDFLIVGAMKAGTTGLFRDLDLNPAVFLPATKEPEGLVDDSVFDRSGLERYAEHYRRARPDQLTGEASTAYTKLPDIPGVAGRAARIVPEARIIYLVREPVARIVSHHRHGVARGTMPDDLGEALDDCSELLDYTRYSEQIAPWLDRYGGRVFVVRFEDYADDRRATVTRVSEFLGIPSRADLIDETVIHNRSSDVRVTAMPLAKLTSSDLYRRRIQVLLSRPRRDRLRKIMVRKASSATSEPSDESIAMIQSRLADDLARLPGLVGDERLRWSRTQG